MDSWKPPELAFSREPYQGKAFPHGHPDHLGAVAALSGIETAPPDRCRVLELGCGDGWNLIPMAEELPGSEFVGVDRDGARLAPGIAAQRQLGLESLELLARDVANLDEKLGRFDYVIAHGLYSWANADVRAVFFDRVRSLLSERGVAYVSVNVYPGWHLSDTSRNLALFHAHVKQPSGGEAFLKELRQVSRFFADQLPRDTPPRALLAEQYRGLSAMSDYLLTFDQLTHTAPEYFEPLVRKVERSSLRYVTDALQIGGQTARLPPHLRRGIAELTPDPILREQYADFCLAPSFRQLVLCRDEQQPGELSAERLQKLFLLSNLRAEGIADPVQRGPVHYQGAAQRITLEAPALKTALAELSAAFPRALPFGELASKVALRLSTKADPSAELATGLLELVALGAVMPRLRPVAVAAQAGERPSLSAASRLQLASFGCATNRHHTIVNLPPGFDREALARLDGRAASEVASGLGTLVERGEIPKAELGAEAGRDLQAAVRKRLEKTIAEAARLALLLPEA